MVRRTTVKAEVVGTAIGFDVVGQVSIRAEVEWGCVIIITRTSTELRITESKHHVELQETW